ncbi:MAG: transcriptional regulator, TetR family [Solirubrobacterales bacterium]|nr:transcriptional regulator, TetR family [Solirubrobacterales bacterium]
MHELPARRAESAQRDDDPVRTSIMEAMLAATGELGYREVAIHHVLERYGGHRVQFWQRFASKEDCFATAYATWADRLATELLTTALAEGNWRRGMRAALVALLRFVEGHTDVARALLIEAEVAGGAALAKRSETIERLGEAIDCAREQAAPAERPPPFTGLFVAGGIATYLSGQLAAGTRSAIWEGLPELMRFATGPYFGEEAAREELEATRAFLDRRPPGKEPG